MWIVVAHVGTVKETVAPLKLNVMVSGEQPSNADCPRTAAAPTAISTATKNNNSVAFLALDVALVRSRLLLIRDCVDSIRVNIVPRVRAAVATTMDCRCTIEWFLQGLL